MGNFSDQSSSEQRAHESQAYEHCEAKGKQKAEIQRIEFDAISSRQFRRKQV
jgi:hypothetical protein